MKKNKLQKLLNILNGADNKTLAGFKAFDSGVQKLKDEMLQTIRANTLDDVNSKLNEMKSSLSLDPLLKALSTLEENFYSSLERISSEMEKMSEEHGEKMEGVGKESSEKYTTIEESVSEMREELRNLISEKSKELANLRSDFNTKLSKSVEEVKGQVIEVVGRIDKSESDLKTLNRDLGSRIDITRNDGERALQITRAELLNAFSKRGGGQANRNIAIGGNVSVLGRFTDINLKAGNNITITYQDNQVTKYTDVTITSMGGGSSVGGTIRSINTVNTSQVMGSVAGTDYVYLATAGIKLDLPPATGNTNLYTVKNVSNSSVLVAGTIDDDVTGIIMPIKYTSVDLISNDTNFNIT